MDLIKDRLVSEILARLKAGPDLPVKVEGSWGSFAPLLAATVSEHINTPILYLCPHIDDADDAFDDLQTFAPDGRIETLPAWETEPRFSDATDEIGARRLQLALQVAALDEHRPRACPIITTSIQALMQPIRKISTITESCLHLETGFEVSPEQLTHRLVDNRFERVDRVDLPGQFARRGGILDIFAPVATVRPPSPADEPSATTSPAVRVEFFGDTIESIRTIDLDTQRSSRGLEAITIIPPVRRDAAEDSQLFCDLLPRNTLVILSEPTDLQEVARIFLERTEEPRGLYSWRSVFERLQKFRQLHICRFAAGGGDEYLKLNIKSVHQYQHTTGSMWSGGTGPLDALVQAAEKNTVVIYCENQAEIQRTAEIITQSGRDVPAGLHLRPGLVHRGFAIDSLNTIIIGHHEIFGRYPLRRRLRAARPAAPIDTVLDLQRGDYVVHLSHGIGKFRGVSTIRKKQTTAEVLTIEYADKEVLHVPVQNIHLIQKYIGTGRRRPRLSKLGSKKWQKQKHRVAAAVTDLAAELLELHAKRENTPGIAFGPDTNWQRQFEEAFPYEETPDQLSAADRIKADMQRAVPMDRLLCGDVGYGKTELAMRAAFKTVENGKQVAVLVPTTVLSVQHYRTFTERFADFPVNIEVLNRFKTSRQSRDIIDRTKKGLVDVLIGTHRLLSGDVNFKDLGLVIIDEEQRFGVRHKERLKKLRINLDILTMTATPIPRTLHMSLLGLRDISALSTPPLDRRSIATTVCPHNPDTIKRAVNRELNRQGQVFFLHNRVRSIERIANDIRRLTAPAKAAVAHGQMPPHQLESAMIDFVVGRTDILVCSTIIESGLDIPNANTIFINDADRFGLAELHQLRGRVGRYKHKAYAYMLLPKTRTITPAAVKRLKTIEEYTELGAGFKIALRDLEIRGAGNILGPQQSGHIQAVGYELYCRLLGDAVKRLQNQPVETAPVPALDLGLTAYIPRNYIPSDRQRLDVYRRIVSAASTEDLTRLKADLSDLFGNPPAEVEMLLDISELRVLAAGHKIKSIVATGHNFVFTVRRAEDVRPLFKNAPGRLTSPRPDTIYLHLDKSYFEPPTLLATLRKILRNPPADSL